VLSGQAALDHETGLVWQRVPSASQFLFVDASIQCHDGVSIGNRFGWRLPTLSELQTLLDITQPDSLPAGHPFTNTPDEYFWTETADPADPQRIQTMTFLNGGNAVSTIGQSRGGATARAWCVRGAAEQQATQPDEQPAWSRRLDATGGCASERFACVMPTGQELGGEAVLDRETGLVWQRVNKPETSPSWYDARFTCDVANTGLRKGWRLPLVTELFSLLPFPAGHPFTITGTQFYTASRYSSGVIIIAGSSASGEVFAPPQGPTSSTNIWCVRGAGGDAGP